MERPTRLCTTTTWTSCWATTTRTGCWAAAAGPTAPNAPPSLWDVLLLAVAADASSIPPASDAWEACLPRTALASEAPLSGGTAMVAPASDGLIAHGRHPSGATQGMVLSISPPLFQL